MSYYGVIRGRHPGVYSDYEKCQQQVHCFSRHYYRKFDRMWEAQIFFGYNREDKNRILSSEHRYYAVIRGRQPGVYSNLKDCERVISGLSNSFVKKFDVMWAARLYFRFNREDEYREYDSRDSLYYDSLEYYDSLAYSDSLDD